MTKYRQRIDNLLNEIEENQKKVLSLQKEEEVYMLGLKEICPSCNGTKTERYCDAAGDMDDRDCLTCHGLGVVGPINCGCGNVIPIDMVYIRRQTFPDCPWCGRRIP